MLEIIKTRIYIGIFIITLVGLFAYFLYSQSLPRSIIQIDGLYDKDGNLLANSLNVNSIIGGIEGIKYVTFRIIAENVDKIPLNMYIEKLTPSEIDFLKPTTKYSIPVGSRALWTTGMVDIEPYEGKIQDFCVVIKAEGVSVIRDAREIEGCISLRIEKNELSSDFKVEVDSGMGDNKISLCNESWICTAFGNCLDGVQERDCTDSNKCGTISNKPEEVQICEQAKTDTGLIQFSTNAINGIYRDNNVWIKLGDKIYSYGGYSSYRCLSQNSIAGTPENYVVCTRPGYDISSRVYLDDNQYGVIFKT